MQISMLVSGDAATFEDHRHVDAVCRAHRPLLDPTFFALASRSRSASDQFFCFINLASWMISQHNASSGLQPVQEGDDAAAAVRALLAALQQLGFTVPPGVSHTQLQTGSGPEVCALLDKLADWCLECKGFLAQQPVHAQADENGCAELHNDAVAVGIDSKHALCALSGCAAVSDMQLHAWPA